MNDKDIFELFQNGFTARNTSDSYSRLCNFVSAMHYGQDRAVHETEIQRLQETEQREIICNSQ